jgi:hypothetical protein
MCEKKDEKNQAETESDWQDDIETRKYYYDDATGYEVYTDKDEDEED